MTSNLIKVKVLILQNINKFLHMNVLSYIAFVLLTFMRDGQGEGDREKGAGRKEKAVGERRKRWEKGEKRREKGGKGDKRRI
jgi:hypothetical protein